MKNLTVRQAYEAMFIFLQSRYEETKSDELGIILGGLSITPDGKTADPSAWSEWLSAVEVAISGSVNIRRQSKDRKEF